MDCTLTCSTRQWSSHTSTNMPSLANSFPRPRSLVTPCAYIPSQRTLRQPKAPGSVATTFSSAHHYRGPVLWALVLAERNYAKEKDSSSGTGQLYRMNRSIQGALLVSPTLPQSNHCRVSNAIQASLLPIEYQGAQNHYATQPATLPGHHTYMPLCATEAGHHPS